MKVENVTSAQNPKVKELLSLREKSSLRREKSLVIVEGRREAQQALAAGFKARTLFFCPEAGGSPEELEADMYIQVSPAVYARIALREGTEGLIAVCHGSTPSLQDLDLGQNPLVMVLEGIEKPGNVGAVLRSADAAGADAVIIWDPLTDIFNPNLIRSSLGAVFTVPVAYAGSADTAAWLKARGIRILTAQLQDSELYYDTPMTGGTAIVVGSEALGLTQVWRDAADAHIRIPMLGKMDSLNASVSAAILLFEAVRQRTSKKNI